MKDYDSENYDISQRISLKRFSSFYSTYKSNNGENEGIHQELLKSIEADNEFSMYYNMIREKESLYKEFSCLENTKMIQILIKLYYFLKDQKDQVSQMNSILLFEKQELLKKNDIIIKEKEENIKSKFNNLKLENEILKNDLSDLKLLNTNYQNDIVTLKHKVKDLKQNSSKLITTSPPEDEGGQEILKLEGELENLKFNLDSMTKQKINLEKISQDYIKRYQDLEQKYENCLHQNNELVEKNKKLELLTRYDGRFGSTNNGIKLEGLILDDEIKEKDITSEHYAGYMKINLKPTKMITSNKKSPINLYPLNKEIIKRDVNLITTDILQNKEQYSKDINKISNFLEFGSAAYSSTISDNEQDMSRQNSCRYSQKNSEVSESQYSEYAVPKNGDYDADSYNSFNYESRVAEYGKKRKSTFQNEEFGTDNQKKVEITEKRPNGYIPPKQKKMTEYTKDDYPSQATDDNDNYHFKNSNLKENLSNTSSYSYDEGEEFESHNRENKNQEPKTVYTYTEYSSYNSNSNYYINEVDPK